MEPFPLVEAPYLSVVGSSFASLTFPLLARMIPTVRSPARQKRTTTAAKTMPAMAPEDRCEDDLEALGLFDGLDTGNDEDVVASALDQQMGLRICEMDIPLDGIVDEVLEVLLRDVALRLLEDVDEDSTALASAIETFAFALAKFVLQTLI